MKTQKILVVQESLSHYRVGVLQKLDESTGFRITFAAGDPKNRKTVGVIPTFSRELLKDTVILRNHRIGPMLWQSGLLKLVFSKRFDAVLLPGNASHLSTWAALLACRTVRIRSLLWTIGWHRPDSNWVKGRIRRTFYGLANRLLLYGEDGYRFGVAAGMPSKAMTVVGNSYSRATQEDHGKETIIELSGSLEDPSIRLVGGIVRLTEGKRLDLLVEAVATLRARGENIGIRLAGSGPMQGAIERRALSLGVPIEFTGAIFASHNIERFYESLDATVLPERAGLSVIQSLSYGTPVVTVDDPTRQVPEFRAVIPSQTGFLYKAGNIGSLADSISQCLTMIDQNSSGVREQCRQEVNSNWSVDSHASRILRAFSDDC